MTEIREPVSLFRAAGGPRRITAGPLGEMLTEYAARGLSGTVRVIGDPGGLVHFSQGGVVAVDTSGAPGPELLLSRSGQISEPSWTLAYAAAAASGQLTAELVRRRLIGAARLEALLRIALADAMFVLAAGQVDSCEAEVGEPVCLLALDPAVPVSWLLAETSRRLAVLTTLPSQLVPDRDRVSAKARPLDQRARLDDAQRDILALANGRRTARDLAFALGRGVFAITGELDRMHAAGLLTIGPRRGAAPAPQLTGPLVARAETAAAGDQAGAGSQTSAASQVEADGQTGVRSQPGAASPAGAVDQAGAAREAGPARELPRRRSSGRGGAHHAEAPPGGSALLRVLRLGFSNPQPSDGGH